MFALLLCCLPSSVKSCNTQDALAFSARHLAAHHIGEIGRLVLLTIVSVYVSTLLNVFFCKSSCPSPVHSLLAVFFSACALAVFVLFFMSSFFICVFLLLEYNMSKRARVATPSAAAAASPAASHQISKKKKVEGAKTVAGKWLVAVRLCLLSCRSLTSVLCMHVSFIVFVVSVICSLP